MDFQRARFQLDFYVCECLHGQKIQTEEGKLRLMELSSKTWSAAFRKEPKYIVVQDTFNLVRMESEVS